MTTKQIQQLTPLISLSKHYIENQRFRINTLLIGFHEYTSKNLRYNIQETQLPLPHFLIFTSHLTSIFNFLPDTVTSIFPLYIFHTTLIIIDKPLTRMEFKFHTSHAMLELAVCIHIVLQFAISP